MCARRGHFSASARNTGSETSTSVSRCTVVSARRALGQEPRDARAALRRVLVPPEENVLEIRKRDRRVSVAVGGALGVPAVQSRKTQVREKRQVVRAEPPLHAQQGAQVRQPSEEGPPRRMLHVRDQLLQRQTAVWTDALEDALGHRGTAYPRGGNDDADMREIAKYLAEHGHPVLIGGDYVHAAHQGAQQEIARTLRRVLQSTLQGAHVPIRDHDGSVQERRGESAPSSAHTDEAHFRDQRPADPTPCSSAKEPQS
ncbi:hypothetical protein HETIRDRAFT_388095 [Heterobasidion irregulare TC 32-1]|uniref:Uncharacterized protein n=1 Tax=Heterobasidion irregulare (strain TC 32-1) TaxID=747525 RepID=W4JX23_HETIT|nr:uncharacterized protein HETIRDRAFT_388095 [Heterobasidion irregulare TC 32-1]ETW78009.1 hypothetical protein HETIRDRAFT_388095 [Heterobasidion irregulare TC 32-1]